MLTRFLAVALFGLTLSGSALAQSLIPADKCALIVASRTSLDEVRAYQAVHSQLSYGPVYLSRNGWYAISVGLIDERAAGETLRQLKADYRIPQDALCSDGDAYVSTVELAPRAGTGAAPIQYGFDEEFDARPMSRDEKRFLQAALALSGDYAGLLDGVWGRGSQTALETWSLLELGRKPTNGDAAAAMLVAAMEIYEWRWESVYYPEFGVSLQLPSPRFTTEERHPRQLHLKDADRGLDVMLFRDSGHRTADFHNGLRGAHDGRSELYALRKLDRWVTKTTEGSIRNYARSFLDRRTGEWITVWVNWADWSTTQGLIISSIEEGRGPELFLQDGSRSADHVSLIVAMLEEEENGPSAPEVSRAWSHPDPVPTPPRGPSSGTGFYVNADGAVLTNAHVVEGCTRLSVDGSPARLLVISEDVDLAVIDPGGFGIDDTWLTFADEHPGLNSDVTVAGYPLHGLLGGLNVTRGAISSLRGFRGDDTTLQISAPVQPGNSGGPAVDQGGNVVGVVVSKLDAVHVADAIGDIPQNINFVIRGDVAQTMLASNGIAFDRGGPRRPFDGPALAAELEAATVLVECE